MRKLLSKKKVVIGALALLFLLSLNLFSAQARGFAISISSPFQAALWSAGEGVSTFFAGGRLQKENQLLKEENLALQQQLIELEDTARENEELRSVLDFGLQEQLQLQHAEIIGKNLTEDTITISAGSLQGIQENMPVITASKVAVGKVIQVFNDYSFVQLLSAKDKKLDAKISETQVTGVVQGEGGQRISLDLVPQEEEFSAGDIVVTSSLGNTFPENILIGKVSEIIKTGADPFQKASLASFFSLKNTEFVLVITSSI